MQFRRLYHSMGRVCCQHVTTRIPVTPTMLKNDNNLIQCDISIQRWKDFFIKVIDVKKPLNRLIGLLVSIYVGHIVKWQPCYEHLNIFYCLWNQICILQVQYISFIPKIIFWLCAATFRQRVVKMAARGSHLGKWRPYIENNQKYFYVPKTLKLHSMCSYQFYQIILFDCLLLF